VIINQLQCYSALPDGITYH